MKKGDKVQVVPNLEPEDETEHQEAAAEKAKRTYRQGQHDTRVLQGVIEDVLTGADGKVYMVRIGGPGYPVTGRLRAIPETKAAEVLKPA